MLRSIQDSPGHPGDDGEHQPNHCGCRERTDADRSQWSESTDAEADKEPSDRQSASATRHGPTVPVVPAFSGGLCLGTVLSMPEFIENKPENPLLPERDLAEDEPDLLSDAELGEAAPALPPLDTPPAGPMIPVPPGPETTVSPLAEAGGIEPNDSLEDMAGAVEKGRLPGD
jgi:hypothetical protein